MIWDFLSIYGLQCATKFVTKREKTNIDVNIDCNLEHFSGDYKCSRHSVTCPSTLINDIKVVLIVAGNSVF